MIPELARNRAGRQDEVMTTPVKDIGEADFQAEVIERSKQVPVVVDFWAPWCGPCRTLGPLLEQAVGALGGRVAMVKIDTDANPALAAQFGIQGIPNVKAFRNGVVVDEFAGALPAPAIAKFLARLVPSPAGEAYEAAINSLTKGDPATAEHTLRGLVDDDEVGSAAAFQLAHLLVRSGGSPAEIRLLAQKVRPSSDLFMRVDALDVLASLLERATDSPEAGMASTDPKDHGALLSAAAMQLARGRVEAALDALLQSVARSPGHAEGAARKSILAIFDHLEQSPGNSDLVRHYRRQLQIVT